MGNAMQEVCCSVQRVDDPAFGFIFTLELTTFFQQEADFRAGFCKFFNQDFFCTGISSTDKVSRAFFRYLQIFQFKADLKTNVSAIVLENLDYGNYPLRIISNMSVLMLI